MMKDRALTMALPTYTLVHHFIVKGMHFLPMLASPTASTIPTVDHASSAPPGPDTDIAPAPTVQGVDTCPGGVDTCMARSLPDNHPSACALCGKVGTTVGPLGGALKLAATSWSPGARSTSPVDSTGGALPCFASTAIGSPPTVTTSPCLSFSQALRKDINWEPPLYLRLPLYLWLRTILLYGGLQFLSIIHVLTILGLQSAPAC